MSSPHVRTVVTFLAAQMDGNQVPPHNSDDLQALAAAIAAIHADPNTTVLCELGLRALGAVIERVRAGIAAEAAMRAFLQSGAGHA